jgi:hypothetical protein
MPAYFDLFPRDEECSSMRDSRAEVPTPPAASPQVVIADRAVALWRAVEGDLSPVLGRRATLALHRRALFLTRVHIAWLPDPTDQDSLQDCLTQLAQTLATRSAVDADAAALALEQAFHDLLASLIGAGLTTQLLRSAWSLRSASGTTPDGSP